MIIRFVFTCNTYTTPVSYFFILDWLNKKHVYCSIKKWIANRTKQFFEMPLYSVLPKDLYFSPPGSMKTVANKPPLGVYFTLSLFFFCYENTYLISLILKRKTKSCFLSEIKQIMSHEHVSDFETCENIVTVCFVFLINKAERIIYHGHDVMWFWVDKNILNWMPYFLEDVKPKESFNLGNDVTLE